MKIKEGNKK